MLLVPGSWVGEFWKKAFLVRFGPLFNVGHVFFVPEGVFGMQIAAADSLLQAMPKETTAEGKRYAKARGEETLVATVSNMGRFPFHRLGGDFDHGKIMRPASGWKVMCSVVPSLGRRCTSSSQGRTSAASGEARGTALRKNWDSGRDRSIPRHRLDLHAPNSKSHRPCTRTFVKRGVPGFSHLLGPKFPDLSRSTWGSGHEGTHIPFKSQGDRAQSIQQLTQPVGTLHSA